jgi:branched-subunit amino acid transport protein AzlD
MNTSINNVLLLTFVMGSIIFFCRAFPFLFFKENNTIDNDSSITRKNNNFKASFLRFVEFTVPPLAMTVLTFNAITSPIYADAAQAFPVLIASSFTVIVHLWRRNPLISIFGGTAVFMILDRVVF